MDDIDIFAELDGIIAANTTTRKVGFTHDDKNNITVDWWTPKWLFDVMELEFDLDPAAPVGGVPWIPTKRYLTEADDGLTTPWEGMVWLNPPYGDKTEDWLAKMHTHRNGVALVFARTDVAWFHKYAAKADALLFLKGRIKFIDGFGATKGQGAGAGSMLIAWGEDAFDALLNFQMLDKGYFISLAGMREAYDYLSGERDALNNEGI